MQITPSLQPFAHKWPLIAFLLWFTYNAINLLGNFQNTIEGWGMMGDILHFIFYTRAGVFVFQFFGLLAVWLAVKQYLKAISEYQPKSPGGGIALQGSVSAILIRAGGLKYELNTKNKKDFLLEAKEPIQSARFTKPRDIIVRPEYLPIIIECENSFWKRMRNKILSVPAPRIVVKRFTEKGVIWDEENTIGADVTIEFTPLQIVKE